MQENKTKRIIILTIDPATAKRAVSDFFLRTEVALILSNLGFSPSDVTVRKDGGLYYKREIFT